MSFADLGWRAVAANVSDLAAMGADPRYLLIAAMLGPGLTLEDVDALAEGIAEGCRAHDVRVAGGDIVRATTTGVTIAAYGCVPALRPLLRRDTRAGDRVVAPALLGPSAARAFALIGTPAAPRSSPGAAAARTARPEARVALGTRRRRRRCRVCHRHQRRAAAGPRTPRGALTRRHRSRGGAGAAAPRRRRAPLGAHVCACDLALGGGEDFELALTGEREALTHLETPGGAL